MITTPVEKLVPTICSFCHTNCGIIARVSNGELLGIKANPDHPANNGDLCPKAMAAREVIYAPDRLKHPLRRTGSGFKKISWDEALDTIATRLLEIKEKYGAETVFRGSGAPVTETARDAFVQFLSNYGSPNRTGSSHLCHAPRTTAFNSLYGGMTQPDYRNTKLIIVWGNNPTDSHRYGEGKAGDAVYGRFTRLMPEAQKRGVKIFVIDPRRTELAATADKWLAVSPGRDDALALAMINTIIKKGLYDREFVSRWTIGFEQLAEHVERFTPEWAEGITGLPAEDIREVAETYATTKPAIIRDGNFIDQYPNAVQTTRAIGTLIAITGNLDVEGGNAFFPYPKLTPLDLSAPRVKKLGDAKYPFFPVVPFPQFEDAVLTGEPYTPRALLVYHANPALINADAKRVRKVLEKLEFMVVSDIFMSATAELADIVLPDSSDFERYGYRSYTSYEGGFIALRDKVIEPVAETRNIFEVEYELAKRMGLADNYPWKNQEEWLNYRLKGVGLTLADLQKQPVQYVTPPLEYRKYQKDGFSTPSGKVEIYSENLNNNQCAPLPEYLELDESFRSQPGLAEKYPLIGTTRKPGIYVHTRFRNIPSLRKVEPEPLLRIHPEDAKARGINSGDIITTTSPQGMINVKAKISDESSPGVVIIDFGWGNPWDKEANVNTLASDKERDPVSCSTPNQRFHCQVSKKNA
ncbi:molybdopterin-dependent oxidoreductase [Chloroflexota bacterium]